MEDEIEIYYRWNALDNKHEYSVVCKERDYQVSYSANTWIFWLWFKMGAAFGKDYRNNFVLLPFACTWDENCKLIKKYKTVNNGTDRVVTAIQKHFAKQKE